MHEGSRAHRKGHFQKTPPPTSPPTHLDRRLFRPLSPLPCARYRRCRSLPPTPVLGAESHRCFSARIPPLGPWSRNVVGAPGSACGPPSPPPARLTARGVEASRWGNAKSPSVHRKSPANVLSNGSRPLRRKSAPRRKRGAAPSLRRNGARAAPRAVRGAHAGGPMRAVPAGPMRDMPSGVDDARGGASQASPSAVAGKRAGAPRSARGQHGRARGRRASGPDLAPRAGVSGVRPIQDLWAPNADLSGTTGGEAFRKDA